MSFVSTLRQWDEAVACAEQRDPDSALRTFLNIEEKNSKIFFNIGCLYLNNSELDEAEKVQLHSRFSVLILCKKTVNLKVFFRLLCSLNYGLTMVLLF